MISTSLIFNSWLRLFMKFSRGLPLLLSPSIFPVTTMFSSPCFLMICPRKLICPALILFINFLSVLPLLNTSSFVTWSFESSTFHKTSGKFTNNKQLFGSKPMSRRRQLSLASSAIAKQVIVGDVSDRNVDSPSNGLRLFK